MEIIALILLLALIVGYIWLTFPGMVRKQQFGDLVVNTFLIAVSLYTTPCFIFRMAWPDLASLLSKLLYVPVHFIYRPWL